MAVNSYQSLGVSWLALFVALGCASPSQPPSDGAPADVPAAPSRITVPGGMFTMGGEDEGGFLGPYFAQPPLSVQVSSFEIDSTEVTVAQFSRWWARTTEATRAVTATVAYPGGVLNWNQTWNMACAGDGDCIQQPTGGSGCNLGVSGRENHPINCVNWYTAMAFCVGSGGRLPTEAEWEFAARGSEGRRWPWGNTPEIFMGEMDDLACRSPGGAVSARSGTCAVTGHPRGATPLGVLGMTGNVWEWTADHYDTHSSPCWAGSLVNPVCDINATGYRVIRGGSWYYDIIGFFRPASRINLMPAIRGSYYGFRCARTP